MSTWEKFRAVQMWWDHSYHSRWWTNFKGTQKEVYIHSLYHPHFVWAWFVNVLQYYIYFHGQVKLHVLAYNVWGMPAHMGGCKYYKQERMKALSDQIRSRKPYFDIFLLEELWMQYDHWLLEKAAKSAGHMIEFRQLASRYVCKLSSWLWPTNSCSFINKQLIL